MTSVRMGKSLLQRGVYHLQEESYEKKLINESLCFTDGG